MINKIINNFKGDRKYFAIVFFILILIFFTAILVPIIVENKEDNWNKELSSRINEIQSSVTSLLKEKEDHLLETSAVLKKNLVRALGPGTTTYRDLIKLVDIEEFEEFSVEVLAPNGRLIAWNEMTAVPTEEIFPLNYPVGQTHFFNSELVTYLTVVDTVHIENDIFYFVLSLQVEKKYTLQNKYFENRNFTKYISEKFYTQFDIDYNPFTQKSKDGRKYSFELLNNKNNKIGLVSFLKPSVTSEVNLIYQRTNDFQSVLIAAAFIFLPFGFRKEFRELKYRFAKLFFIIFYFTVFRIVLYTVSFPSRLLEGELVDPAYFSSAFAWGIVKSPIEFFVTALFFLLVCVHAYRYLTAYLKERSARLSDQVIPDNRKSRNWLRFIYILPLVLLFFLSLRGLSATIKSVILDSTLHYFRTPDLIPDFPSMVMNLNIIVTGLAMVLVLCSLVMLICSFFQKNNHKKSFLYLFITFQILGLIFLAVQKTPLITPVMSIFFITIIFFLSNRFYKQKRGNQYNYIYAMLGASLITITLLNYFNQGLERESLKTAALEINRPNDNLLRFLIDETIKGALKNEEVVSSFLIQNTNYNAFSFLIWSNSSLQRESFNSSIAMYDRDMNLLGSFSAGIDNYVQPLSRISEFKNDKLIKDNKPNIFVIDQPGGSFEKLFVGVIPVRARGILVGFISAVVGYKTGNPGNQDIPPFLVSKQNLISSVLDINQLKIFEFTDSRVTQVFGDIYPSRDQSAPILNAKFSPDNEAWINLSLNDENYITYAVKTNSDDSERIISVSMQQKQFTLNLFNFFKIFVIHSLYILVAFLLIFMFKFRKINYTFRAQLLFSFLIISILPVIILAVYNRQVVKERSNTAVFNELNERTNYLENHFRVQITKYPERDYHQIFEDAGKELGISFGIYETTDLIFNSKEQYYNIGLFPSKLNPEAYYHLNYLSYREYLIREKIENFEYHSFYKKITLDDKNFIIGVNDAFNKVNIVFSVVEVDVFLFGIYSFAVIIILIMSTILANNISAPIRRLTKATKSLAQGDLNVEIINKEKGEIKDLIDGFNTMTKELQKNQIELAELERENAWKEMAKQVAHEIKNPLTPLKLAVQQLMAAFRDRSRNFDAIFEKVSTTLLNQIENLNLIASEFSRFAKMPSIKLEEVDIISITKDSINLFTDEKVKIDLETDLSSAIIEADLNQLRRLLINLIRNSIQAGATKININVLSEDGKFFILVKDNGAGIPEQFRDKIFDSNFTTKEKGMGLGLKLSKRFLEGINGNISLLETSDTGTTFKITFNKISENSVTEK